MNLMNPVVSSTQTLCMLGVSEGEAYNTRGINRRNTAGKNTMRIDFRPCWELKSRPLLNLSTSGQIKYNLQIIRIILLID